MATSGFEFQKSLKEKNPLPFLRYFPVERYLTRPLASLVVRAVYRTRLTPNQLTIASLFFGIAAGAAYLGASPGWFVPAGVLVYLSSIIDCADGMLARSRDQCTRFGLLLDLFCDRIVDFAILTGVSLGIYRYSGNLWLGALGLLISGFYFMQLTLHYLMEGYQGRPHGGNTSEARGLAAFIFFALSLVNRLDLIIFVSTAAAVLHTVSMIIRLIRWGRLESRD